eukprot:scaffold24189_cov100-Isochrysis_galbana.AAC.3
MDSFQARRKGLGRGPPIKHIAGGGIGRTGGRCRRACVVVRVRGGGRVGGEGGRWGATQPRGGEAQPCRFLECSQPPATTPASITAKSESRISAAARSAGCRGSAGCRRGTTLGEGRGASGRGAGMPRQRRPSEPQNKKADRWRPRKAPRAVDGVISRKRRDARRPAGRSRTAQRQGGGGEAALRQDEGSVGSWAGASAARRPAVQKWTRAWERADRMAQRLATA